MNNRFEAFELNEAVEKYVTQLESTGEVDPDLQASIEQNMDRLEQSSVSRIEAAILAARDKEGLATTAHTAIERLQLMITNRKTKQSETAQPPTKTPENRPESPGFLEGQTEFFQNPEISAGRRLLRVSAIASGAYVLLGLAKWVKNKATGSEDTKEGLLSTFLRYTGLATLAGAGVAYLSGKLGGSETKASEVGSDDRSSPAKNERADEPRTTSTGLVGPPEGTNLFENTAKATLDGNEVTCSIGNESLTVNGNTYAFSLTAAGKMAAKVPTGGGTAEKIVVFGAVWQGGTPRIKAGLVYKPLSFFGNPKPKTYQTELQLSKKDLLTMLKNGSANAKTFTVGMVEFTRR